MSAAYRYFNILCVRQVTVGQYRIKVPAIDWPTLVQATFTMEVGPARNGCR